MPHTRPHNEKKYPKTVHLQIKKKKTKQKKPTEIICTKMPKQSSLDIKSMHFSN